MLIYVPAGTFFAVDTSPFENRCILLETVDLVRRIGVLCLRIARGNGRPVELAGGDTICLWITVGSMDRMNIAMMFALVCLATLSIDF